MKDLPEREGPVHWHPEFEIVTAMSGVLDYQVGEEHIQLPAGKAVKVGLLAQAPVGNGGVRIYEDFTLEQRTVKNIRFGE